MFVDLDWPLNASSLLSASAELLVLSVISRTFSGSEQICCAPVHNFYQCTVVHSADVTKKLQFSLFYQVCQNLVSLYFFLYSRTPSLLSLILSRPSIIIIVPVYESMCLETSFKLLIVALITKPRKCIFFVYFDIFQSNNIIMYPTYYDKKSE